VIFVFGSINIDLVTKVARIPGPGETVLGGGYATIPGGKGANQALAARRAGSKVALVGAVGKDAFAVQALALLRAEGVDLSAIRECDAPTGAAFIAVDAQGENAIVVAAGANMQARAAQLESLDIAPGDILLLQRETPMAEAEAAAVYAKSRSARVMLNLAPAGPASPTLLHALDFVCVNEHEAAALGAMLGVADVDPKAIVEKVHTKLNVATIVTLGAAGAAGFDAGLRVAASAPSLSVVDTTGAGDTFVGAFAAALDQGASFEAAMRNGVAAGSLACTKAGAQPSMPSKVEIAALVARFWSI
jgi:ribokinase